MRIRPKYPVLQHTLVALPSVFVVLTLLFAFPSEWGVAAYFDRLEKASPLAERVFECVSAYGNIPFYAFYVFLLYLGVRRNHHESRRFVAWYLVTLGFTLVVTNLLKFGIGRPRPGVGGDFAPFSSADSHQSLPSSHMTETTVTTLPLMHRFGNVGLPLAAGVSNALMGFSRIFLGEHHPSDILISLAVGGAIAYASWRLFHSGFARGLMAVRRTAPPARSA